MKQRYSVLVLPYSLQAGEVGKPYAGHLSSMDGEISRHSTLKAAARSLHAVVKAAQRWEAATPGTVTKEKAWKAYEKAEKAFQVALNKL